MAFRLCEIIISGSCHLLFLFAILVNISIILSDKSKTPTGHLKKLGSHRDPLGVTMIGKFSTPAVFYEHFVKPGKPLWMRSVLEVEDHPGLTNWTDAFFKKQYGSEIVQIETSKKEKRKSIPNWITFRQFLSLYTTEDIYMVQTLTNKMEELVLIPTTLQCGGFQRAIQEAVLWMGSGTTMSVLHSDELDNLLCLLDGRKELVLIDKVYKSDVEADGFVESGSYSTVNVAKVDLIKFPRLASVPWHEVHLDKGDCVFIPRGWYHQVNSSKFRHLAVNLWFSHILWFNSVNCSDNQNFHKPLEPISTFGFASPNEVYRSKLLEKLHDKGILLKDVFVSSLDTSTEERRSQFFEAIDRYTDSVLSWSELYGFDIDKAIQKFPDIFGLPGTSVTDDEKVILYDPIPTVDNAPEKDNSGDYKNYDNENNVASILPAGSQGVNSDLNEASSLPLPEEPVVGDASQTENEWNHHDLYKHSDVSETDDTQDAPEHTENLYYSYTESEEEDQGVPKVDKKDEL